MNKQKRLLCLSVGRLCNSTGGQVEPAQHKKAYKLLLYCGVHCFCCRQYAQACDRCLVYRPVNTAMTSASCLGLCDTTYFLVCCCSKATPVQCRWYNASKHSAGTPTVWATHWPHTPSFPAPPLFSPKTSVHEQEMRVLCTGAEERF